MIRYTVYFDGRVQGVGFRYTACNIAQDFKVAGFVENLSDGRVKMVAEGSKDQLDGLVDAIKQRMAGYVRKSTIDSSQANREFGEPALGALDVRY
jgi:acylphosphatase